jgi:hypothetical protein
MENFAPLYDVGGRLVEIIKGLADQLIVKAPITTAMLMGGSAGYTINFFRWVFAKYNEWGRATTQSLLSDARAKKAADAAVASTKDALQTGIAVGFIANQLGVLPVSAVLAVILWQIQASVAIPAGRAYVVSSLFAWYSGQNPETQAEINAAAKEYALKAQALATLGAKEAATQAGAAKASLDVAAKALAPLLIQGASAAAGATGNAFQAVASGIATNIGSGARAFPDLPKDVSAAERVLVDAANAAAGAVGQAAVKAPQVPVPAEASAAVAAPGRNSTRPLSAASSALALICSASTCAS